MEVKARLVEATARVALHGKAFLGEQPEWVVNQLNGATREKATSARRCSPRTDAAVPVPACSLPSVSASPRWGVALPTVHASSMPMRPTRREQASGAAAGPRKRRQQQEYGLGHEFANTDGSTDAEICK